PGAGSIPRLRALSPVTGWILRGQFVRRVASLLAAVASLCLVAVPEASASSSIPLPENAVVVFPGHGWGHGRGMGQWGAKGLADQGKTYAQILSTYYPGTTLGTRSSTENIRVLLETSSDVIASSDQPFTARWSNNSIIATSDATYRYFKATWDGTNYHLYKSTAWNGTWTLVKTTPSIIVFKPGSAMIQLITSGGSIHVYRGSIEAHQGGSSINSINVLTMQQYLYGVVPRESPE